MVQKDIERAVALIRDYPVIFSVTGTAFVYTIKNSRGRMIMELQTERTGASARQCTYSLTLDGKKLADVNSASRTPQDMQKIMVIEMLERMANAKKITLPHVRYAR